MLFKTTSASSTERLFLTLCEHISVGTLQVRTPDGRHHSFGGGQPEASMTVRDWSFVSAVLARGDVGLGESYVRGSWDSPDLSTFLLLMLKNADISDRFSGGGFAHRSFFRFVDAILRRNSQRGSRRNIEAHYDVGNEFYSLWLDPGMTYSSAMFDDGELTLEAAQTRKYDRLLSLLPEKAERLLEIGCGWGGFAERAAQSGRHVTGVTVSKSQFGYAHRRLGDRAQIRLQDYRDIAGKFDSIVSIEMLEAVGERYWPQYFRKIKQSLSEGGRAALQVILIEDQSFERYRKQSDFIRQYTFPGGMLVPPARISACARDAGLVINSFHRFGEDYARTLRAWLSRFDAVQPQIRNLGYDEEFLRSWRYYFEFCIAGFTHGEHINVAQISLSHD